MMELPKEPAPAVVFTNGLLAQDHAKTCHGLLRGSRRFRPVAVLDEVHAGRDAGEVMDGRHRAVPVVASLSDWVASGGEQPEYFVVGVAFSGGRLPDDCRPEIREALKRGMTVVCGLHQMLGDDPEFAALAREHGGRLIDVRRPRPTGELSFWTGEIYSVKAKVVAVLGTDCAIGKRTTAKFLSEACNAAGIKAEMIFTGQTGWMQGHRHGFLFDATVNDFIGGEIERVLVECDRETAPDVMFIEGQSALRNPSGPCGSEFLLSGNARAVVLQHAPGRPEFVDHEGYGAFVPSVEDEIALIRAYGSDVLAVTINEIEWSRDQLDAYRDRLEARIGLPVVFPLRGEVERLVPVIRQYVSGPLADRPRAGRAGDT